MTPLQEILQGCTDLRRKLFQVEFLSTLSGELLITLIYHRPLDDAWHAVAQKLAESLSCKIIGRSRKQKRVLDTDWVEEVVEVEGQAFRYRQPEQCFTQPNGFINQKMMGWLLEQCDTTDTDLLELYCGIGNFTLPLSQRFRNVLATELSKPATAAARWNAESKPNPQHRTRALISRGDDRRNGGRKTVPTTRGSQTATDRTISSTPCW